MYIKIKEGFLSLTLNERVTIIIMCIGAVLAILTFYFSFFYTPASDLKVNVYGNLYQKPALIDISNTGDDSQSDTSSQACPYQLKNGEIYADALQRLADEAKVYILISVKNQGKKNIPKATLLSKVPGLYESPGGEYSSVDCYGAHSQDNSMVNERAQAASSIAAVSGGSSASIDLGSFDPDEVKQIHVWQKDYRIITNPGRLSFKVLDGDKEVRVSYHIHADNWYFWLRTNIHSALLVFCTFGFVYILMFHSKKRD